MNSASLVNRPEGQGLYHYRMRIRSCASINRTIDMRLLQSWKRGLQFIRFSGHFLVCNKDLLVFPIVSFFASIGIIIFSVYAGSVLNKWQFPSEEISLSIFILELAIGYFCLSFVVLYFSACLYFCTLSRLSGQNASLREGMQVTAKKWKPLIGWCILSTTVGFIIQALERISDILADFFIIVLGLSWSIASYFVVPALISENIGPLQALKQGTHTLKKGWRKALSVNAIIYLALFLIYGIIALIVKLSASHIPTIISQDAVSAIALIALVLAIIVSKVFNTIITSGLYLSIVKAEKITDIDPELVNIASSTNAVAKKGE